MRALRFARAAREDLIEIHAFSCAQWGEAQADRYLDQIRNTCEALARGDRPGRDIGEVRAGCRLQSVGRHFIVFRLADDGALRVVRVLHQRMDIAAHL